MQQEAPILAIFGDPWEEAVSTLFTRIRSDDSDLCGLYVFGLWVHCDDREHLLGYGRGFDVVVQKPFNASELISFVARLSSVLFPEPPPWKSGASAYSRYVHTIVTRGALALLEARRRWRMEHDGVVG